MASRSITARDRTFERTHRATFKNVLFATDLSSAAEKGLPYAIEIARRYSARLHVVHVASPVAYPYAPAVAWPKLAEGEQAFRSEAKAKLEQQLQSVPHELIFQQGDVWPTLRDLIRLKEADLLVLSTHGRSGMEKALMGSVAERVFHQAACPVLTVGPKVTVKSRHAAELNRILYATDFSPESLAAAPYAISLAEEHRTQLILLNCFEEKDAEVRAMLQTLHQLVPFGADLRCEPICIVERGAHGQKILDVAEGHGADLIVLGIDSAYEHSFRKARFQQRSDLYKIVTQASCPVLTVRN